MELIEAMAFFLSKSQQVKMSYDVVSGVWWPALKRQVSQGTHIYS